MEKKNEKKIQTGVIRVLLLTVLLALGGWVYQQNVANNETLTASIQITENLLDRQIAITRGYAQKLALLQENFNKTETLLKTVQDENRKLNDQLALLSNVQDLQATVDRLKTENGEILAEVRDLRQQVALESRNITDIAKGQELIHKFKDRIRSVKVRIKELQNDAYIQKVAAQREKDRMGLMLGNNGFLTRNGEQTAADFNATPAMANKDIQVNVTIVK
jgi:hypothetical protein